MALSGSGNEVGRGTLYGGWMPQVKGVQMLEALFAPFIGPPPCCAEIGAGRDRSCGLQARRSTPLRVVRTLEVRNHVTLCRSSFQDRLALPKRRDVVSLRCFVFRLP